MSREEVAKFLSWKNKVRHGLVKWVRQKNWKPNARYQIRKLKWLLSHDSSEAMAAAWQTLDPDRRARIWPNVMSSALGSCPENALEVLRATLDPLPPGYAVQDIIQFLAVWQNVHQPSEPGRQADRLANTVTDLLALYHDREDTRLVFRQSVFYQVISTIDISKLHDLYSKFMAYNHKLHPNTLLHLASRLAKDPAHRDDALRIATAMADVGAVDLAMPSWASLCTTILSSKPQQDEQEATPWTVEAFETLLRSGLTPNLINFTALIRSLCAAGRLDTAWAVVGIMDSHKIEPDAVLVSTLLEGGRQASSVPNIERSTKMAVDCGVLDVPFLNGLLSCVYDFSVVASARPSANAPRIVPAFFPMLYYYSRVFHMEPLQHLIPVDLAAFAKPGPSIRQHWERPSRLFPALELAVAAVPEKLHPTGTTLALMYIAYVRSLSKASSVLSLYSYIRQLIARGDKVYATFVREKGTLLHDVVIARLCEHPGMLRAALDVIGDMLKAKKAQQAASPAPVPAAAPGARVDVLGALAAQADAPSHPAPSMYTWSILLHGFMAARETASGERIVSMMRENGMQPTLVTWNTLLSGYVRVQNASKVMATLRGIEERGLQADEYTTRAFAKVARKESVLREIEMFMSNRQPETVEGLPEGTSTAKPEA
jgi:pentatricopeptide repeat protein